MNDYRNLSRLDSDGFPILGIELATGNEGDAKFVGPVKPPKNLSNLDKDGFPVLGIELAGDLVHEADAHDLHSLMAAFSAHDNAHGRAGTEKSLSRDTLADALEENDRHEEAELLRDYGKHVIIHEGRAVPARYNVTHVLNALHHAVNHISDVPGYEFQNFIHDGLGVPVHMGGRAIDHENDPEGSEQYGKDTHAYPYGAVMVPHHHDDQSESWNAHMHASELPEFLANHIETEMNLSDDTNYDRDDGDILDWSHDDRITGPIDAIRHAPYEEPAFGPRNRTTREWGHSGDPAAPINHERDLSRPEVPYASQWWMTPKGELIPVRAHLEWLEKEGYVKDPDGKDDDLDEDDRRSDVSDKIADAYTAAFKKGYHRVYVDTSGLVSDNPISPPTSTQRRELIDHAIIHKLATVMHFNGQGKCQRLWTNPEGSGGTMFSRTAK